VILHGNQRGGGKDLAHHLMKQENERVQVHEIRGFMANTLEGAFVESHAISKATKCKQHLYSLSISPPKGADISNAAFVDAANQVETSLGLINQPRAIVFHDKRGDDGELRRHAHVVWCRIDTDKMKAVELPYTKYRLRDVSRELHIRHDLKMPDGLIRSKDRDPRNFTLAEWQQSKRAGKDVRQIKNVFRDCWAISDSQASFAHALEEHGYFLAKGRRGHVAVDYQGEKYAVSRYAGIEAQQVRAKLGDADSLPSIEQAHAKAAQQVNKRLTELKANQRQEFVRKRQGAERATAALQVKQSDQRKQLAADQRTTVEKQTAEHEARLRKGLMGFVDRLTGRRKKAVERNTHEQAKLRERITRERAKMRHIQNATKAASEAAHNAARAANIKAAMELRKDIKTISNGVSEAKDHDREAFIRKRKAAAERPRRRSRNIVEPSHFDR
jgi:hypothetical protein